MTKNCRFGIQKRIWRNGFSFARLALSMKDSLGFFRLKESTGKKINPDADCVGLPEEVFCWFHPLRGPVLKTKSIEKMQRARLGKSAGDLVWRPGTEKMHPCRTFRGFAPRKETPGVGEMPAAGVEVLSSFMGKEIRGKSNPFGLPVESIDFN